MTCPAPPRPSCAPPACISSPPPPPLPAPRSAPRAHAPWRWRTAGRWGQRGRGAELQGLGSGVLRRASCAGPTWGGQGQPPGRTRGQGWVPGVGGAQIYCTGASRREPIRGPEAGRGGAGRGRGPCLHSRPRAPGGPCAGRLRTAESRGALPRRPSPDLCSGAHSTCPEGLVLLWRVSRERSEPVLQARNPERAGAEASPGALGARRRRRGIPAVSASGLSEIIPQATV